MKVFKDFLKRDLAIGDYVIFPGPYAGGMKLGRIIKFTPQQIRVEWTYRWRDQVHSRNTIRPSGQCVRVEGPELTLYLLSGDY